MARRRSRAWGCSVLTLQVLGTGETRGTLGVQKRGLPPPPDSLRGSAASPSSTAPRAQDQCHVPQRLPDRAGLGRVDTVQSVPHAGLCVQGCGVEGGLFPILPGAGAPHDRWKLGTTFSREALENRPRQEGS